MGGSAFSAGPDPLCTPRMPPEIYTVVKERCSRALLEVYTCVASPIDGPGKNNFGDVDIFVSWPRDPTADVDIPPGAARMHAHLSRIAQAIGADRVLPAGGAIIEGRFAVGWPGDETKFIQVDVRVFDSAEELQWLLFKHSHGDIWSILGSVIRPLGLSIAETALCLRIPEIERADHKRSRVFLTADPATVLDFLGLPISGFWDRPFPSLDAMFEYVAQCRMFWVADKSADRGDGDGDGGGDGGGGGEDGAGAGPKKLRGKDRRRIACRPTFRSWVEDFIPRCRAEGRYATRQTSRDQITRDAFSRFHVEPEYTATRREFVLQQHRLMIKNGLIKTEAPIQVDHLADRAAKEAAGLFRKALMSIVLDGDRSYGIEPPGDELKMQGEDELFDLDLLKLWIGEFRHAIQMAIRARHPYLAKTKGGVAGDRVAEIKDKDKDKDTDKEKDEDKDKDQAKAEETKEVDPEVDTEVEVSVEGDNGAGLAEGAEVAECTDTGMEVDMAIAEVTEIRA